jgi:O-antigen/teichoic acid export membrane protein
MLVHISRYFLAALFPPAIAFVSLPIITGYLGPEEFGAFALSQSVSALIVAISAAGLGFVIARRLPTLQAQERAALVRGAMVVVTSLAMISALVGAPLATMIMHISGSPALVRSMLLICIGGAVFQAPWLVAAEVLTIDFRASGFAVGTLLQGLVQACTTIGLLSLFGTGATSLAWGYLAGSAAAAVCALVLLRRDLYGRTIEVRDFLSEFHAQFRAKLSSSGLTAFERFWLMRYAGAAAVGLYNHADFYRNFAMLLVNVISRSFYPVNLAEARDIGSGFQRTRESWVVVQAGLVAAIAGFALFGESVISVLTSGKFNAAWPYAVLFLMVLLVQTAGKAQMSLLVAHRTRTIPDITTFSSICGFAAFAVLVPVGGLPGALGAVFLRVIMLRGAIVWASRKIRPIPFEDHFVIVGLVVGAALLGWMVVSAPSVAARIAVGAVVVAGLGLATFNKIGAFVMSLAPLERKL